MPRAKIILKIKPERKPVFVAQDKANILAAFVGLGLFILIKRIFPSSSWLDFFCDAIVIVIVLVRLLLWIWGYLQRVITTYYVTTKGIVIEKRLGKFHSKHGLRYTDMKKGAWYYAYGHGIGTLYINWRYPFAFDDVAFYWLRPVIHKKRTALYFIANGKRVRDVVNTQWKKANQ